MKYQNKLGFGTVIRHLSIYAAVIFSFCEGLTSDAQEKSVIDRLRDYPETFLVMNGTRDIEWRIQQYESYSERLQKLQQELNDELRESDAVAEALNEKKPNDYRLATEAIREQLTGRCLEKMLDARIEIAANEALLKELKTVSETDKKQKNTKLNPVIKARLSNLHSQLELQRVDHARLEQLQQQGVSSSASLSKSKLELQKLEGEISVLEAEAQVSIQSQTGDQSQRIVDLTLETKRLKALDAAALAELKKLGTVDSIDREIADRQSGTQALLDRRKIIVARLSELSLEIEDLRSLKNLVESTRKELEKSKTPPTKDGEDAKE